MTEDQNARNPHFDSPNNEALSSQSVELWGLNHGYNPSSFNTQNTWNDYGPSYPVHNLDGSASLDPMFPITPFGQGNITQSSVPMVSNDPDFFFFDNGSFPISNAVGVASAGPPLVGAAALTSYAPPPNLLARFPCTYPGCTKDFKRRSEMTRHYRQVHDLFGPKFSCSYHGCSRHGFNGFARKDKLRDHQKAAHGVAL